MYLKFVTAAAIGALISTAAIAQTPGASSPSTKSAQTTSTATETASAKGEWQASKLIHMNVYNAQNDKIGDIKELMLDKNGKIDVVAIAVGGFLGMGEHDVAVKFDKLKWVNEPVKSTTSSNTKLEPRDNHRLGADPDDAGPQLSRSRGAGCNKGPAEGNAAVRL